MNRMGKERSGLSPEEKREERFNKWLSPPDVFFSSPEAEKMYKCRVHRLIDAIKMKDPDRVPVDQTDMVRAKEVLGNTSCIAGHIPTSILHTGSPKAVEEYCRKRIEVCGKGGGYILTGDANIDEGNPDNFRAIMEAAKAYGVHK